jgi:hypothetical protein
MPAINSLYRAKILHFDTKAVGLFFQVLLGVLLMLIQTKFLRGFLGETTAHYDFMTNLSIMIQLLAAPANAILTLEGQNTTSHQIKQNFYMYRNSD